MVWRFLTHYGANKANDLIHELAAQVVRFDPHSSSEAEISMIEAELDKLGRRIAEAELEVRREHKETLTLRKRYDEHVKAAEVLEKSLAAETDAARRSEIEASLTRLVSSLEEMTVEIAREEEEDREVEVWGRELRTSYDALAEKLKSARRELGTARRQMETASLQRERATERGQLAMERAGLSGVLSTVGVALAAMNQETSRARAETAAMTLKAEALAPRGVETDPHIEAALAKARHAELPGKGSVQDRLKALKGEKKPRLLTAS